MKLEGQIGPAQYGDGTMQPFRMGKFGAGLLANLHGWFYEQTYRGNVFSYCNQSANALITFPATAITATQLVLSNNNGSGKNLVLINAGVATTTASTVAQTIALVGGWSATNVIHTTPATPICNLIGQSAGVGKIDLAATLPTTVPAGPTVLLPLYSQGISAINPNIAFVDIGGSIIVPPGGFVTFQCSGATMPSAVCSISWEEVSV